mgnify:CR=1 FL=1
MDTYITGQTIKMLREKKGFTQAELAEKLNFLLKIAKKQEKDVFNTSFTVLF